MSSVEHHRFAHHAYAQRLDENRHGDAPRHTNQHPGEGLSRDGSLIHQVSGSRVVREGRENLQAYHGVSGCMEYDNHSFGEQHTTEQRTTVGCVVVSLMGQPNTSRNLPLEGKSMFGRVVS